MAGKPTVTMTLAGDEKKLTEAFDRVGVAAKDMGSKVDSTSSDFSKAGRSADDFAEASDTAESRSQGFSDTITGVKDAFTALNDSSLSTTDKLVAFGQAGADLAGGFTNFVIPAVAGLWRRITATTIAQRVATAATVVWSAVTKGAAVAMRILNAVMRANPIILVVSLIALLVGAFIALWNKSAGFRKFFINMWNGIKNTVGTVVGWIRDRWNGLVDWFRNIPSRIGRALGNLGGIVKNAFKGAINGVIDGLNWFLNNSLNWLIDRINDVSSVVGIPAIPRIPNIPRLHTGGVVPGMPGEERLAVLQGGERVSTSGQGGQSVTLMVASGADRGVSELINYLARKKLLTAVVTQ